MRYHRTSLVINYNIQFLICIILYACKYIILYLYKFKCWVIVKLNLFYICCLFNTLLLLYTNNYYHIELVWAEGHQRLRRYTFSAAGNIHYYNMLCDNVSWQGWMTRVSWRTRMCQIHQCDPLLSITTFIIIITIPII